MIIPLFKVISSHSLQKTSALETAIDTFLTNPSEESVKPLIKSQLSYMKKYKKNQPLKSETN